MSNQMINYFMDNILLMLVIVVLVFIIIGLIVSIKNKLKHYDQMMSEFESEAVVSLTKVEKDFENEKEKLALKIENDYKAKLENFKTHVEKVEKISRTTSEVKTDMLLTNLKKNLITEGMIRPLQMYVLSNIFIPFKKNNGEIQPVKIDHILLMRTGIYIIDTSEYHGNVFYGITNDRAKEFSFILDDLFPLQEKDTEKTIVVSNKHVDQLGVNLNTAESPAKQLANGVEALSQLLAEHEDYKTVTPLLYFDLHGNRLINFSELKTPYVFADKQKLKDYFVREAKEENKIYSDEDLENIKYLITNGSIH
ncbi:nuclease-related domain-containing protein [Halobacillus massiliensis]|uniref:nuclease-related domain-containing protein n=1 Tax=Halobacillus massiliensis TaxID=1926286 RepID=UPI0009E64E08|nr:nuclease-related domain-containing protein [Halobacillus massiliensis]